MSSFEQYGTRLSWDQYNATAGVEIKKYDLTLQQLHLYLNLYEEDWVVQMQSEVEIRVIFGSDWQVDIRVADPHAIGMTAKVWEPNPFDHTQTSVEVDGVDAFEEEQSEDDLELIVPVLRNRTAPTIIRLLETVAEQPACTRER